MKRFGFAWLSLLVFVSSTAVLSSTASALPSSWSVPLGSWNYQSSPTAADIDGDGDDELLIGSRDGYLRAFDGDGTLLWASPVVPFIPAGCTPQSVPSPIDSTPAVGDLDGDGTVEIVVGAGSSWNRGNHSGGLVAFSHTGAVEWKWQGNRDYGSEFSFDDDGRCEGVVSSPAIGDVDGDGFDDVVFGGFDGRIWALDASGDTVPGFPFESYDTIWSSPALFDVDNDGRKEIFVGADSWPGVVSNFHTGGLLRALDLRDGEVVQLWAKLTSDTVSSSPAIGDINGDGRADIVFGTGEYWHVVCATNIDPACPSYNAAAADHKKVWAVDALDGSDLAGWPVSAQGSVQTSPALGDIDGDGLPEVVFGSYDERVYAFNGDGSQLWSVAAVASSDTGGAAQSGRRITGSPIIADLDGDSDLDVAVGNELFVGLHDGLTGEIFGNSGWAKSFLTTPAIFEHQGARYIAVSGFTGTLASSLNAYQLPATTVEDAWPQFHRDAGHTGSLGASWCDVAGPSTAPFCDVFPGRWYSNAVLWAYATDLTTGVAPRIFAPNRVLTRAEMITFLWRLNGSLTGFDDTSFYDVATGSFYDDAVKWGVAFNITNGISPESFAPRATVTRAQMVTMLWRLDGRNAAPPSGFNDVPVGRYYSLAVDWAAAVGVTTGTGGSSFSPDDPVTRAQLVTMLHRWSS